MEQKEIVQKLRELAKECDGISVYLPTVLKEIASGNGSQAEWSRVEIDNIFVYMADMLEE